MGLFAPKWKSKKPLIRKGAAWKESDPKVLKKMALVGEDDVSSIAISKIRDKAILTEIAKTARSAHTRRIASRMIMEFPPQSHHSMPPADFEVHAENADG